MKLLFSLIAGFIFLASCSEIKMSDAGGQKPSAAAAATTADLTSVGAADTANKFTSAELQAVEAHLQKAIPLAVVAIIDKIMKDKPSIRPGFASFAPYSALDPTKVTKTGDDVKSLAIEATVAKEGQQDPLLQIAIRLQLKFLNGCLDQGTFEEKSRCLVNLGNHKTEADLGKSNVPGITFAWNAGVITIDVLNPVTGTGVIEKMKYHADLPETAAKTIKGELSSEEPNGFSFAAKKLTIKVNVEGLFALLDPANKDKKLPVTFDVEVAVDKTQLMGNVEINGKTDVLRLQAQKPLMIAVHGQPAVQAEAKILGGVVEASLQKHFKGVVDLNPDAQKPLTIVVKLGSISEKFDASKIGDMAEAYGVVSAQISLPEATSVFKSLRCEVPQAKPLSYIPLITEAVYNFGRILETSYGWTEEKFTGAAPGTISPICSF